MRPRLLLVVVAAVLLAVAAARPPLEERLRGLESAYVTDLAALERDVNAFGARLNEHIEAEAKGSDTGADVGEPRRTKRALLKARQAQETRDERHGNERLRHGKEQETRDERHDNERLKRRQMRRKEKEIKDKHNKARQRKREERKKERERAAAEEHAAVMRDLEAGAFERVLFHDSATGIVFYDAFYRRAQGDVVFLGPAEEELLFSADSMTRGAFNLRAPGGAVPCTTGYEQEKAIVFAVVCAVPHRYRHESVVRLEYHSEKTGKTAVLSVPVALVEDEAAPQHFLAVHTMVRGMPWLRAAVWLAYCSQLLGVDHFYIYLDFDPHTLFDAEAARAALPAVFRDAVTFVPWNAPRMGHGLGSWFKHRQMSAMNHALWRWGPRTRWLGLFDQDEFPFPMAGGARPGDSGLLAAHLKRLDDAVDAVSLACVFFSPKLRADDAKHAGGDMTNVTTRMSVPTPQRDKLIVRPARIPYMSDPHHLSLPSQRTNALDPDKEWRLNHFWARRNPTPFVRVAFDVVDDDSHRPFIEKLQLN